MDMGLPIVKIIFAAGNGIGQHHQDRFDHGQSLTAGMISAATQRSRSR